MKQLIHNFREHSEMRQILEAEVETDNEHCRKVENDAKSCAKPGRDSFQKDVEACTGAGKKSTSYSQPVSLFSISESRRSVAKREGVLKKKSCAGREFFCCG